MGDFAQAEARKFEDRLAPLGLGERQQRRNAAGQEVSSYIVHIPPQANRAAAEKKVAMHNNRNLFPATIAALVESGAEVALLAHYFEGSFDEPFEIATRRELGLAEFMTSGGKFPEDELTVIVR